MTLFKTLPTRTAFLLGMSLSLLPALGPFSAALLLFARRWTLERRDALWAVAAVVFALPGLLRGDPLAGLGAAAAVAGPWIVFRTFAEAKRLHVAEERRGPLALGLLVGFAAIVVLALLRSVDALELGATRTVAEAIVWQSSPALFGHTVLVLGGAIALLTREHRRVAFAALGITAFGILVSGSVEAGVAWVVLAVAQIGLRPSGDRRPRTLEVVALLATVAAASLLAPLLGWGRVGFLSPDGEAPVSRNLLVGSELARGDWWDDRWVDVATDRVSLNGRELTAYEVTKRGVEPWLRLQQLVPLTPGASYTLSAWIEANDDAVPGFQGWGEAAPDADTLVLDARLRGESWSARLSGPGEVLDAGTLERDGAWQRVFVSFRYAPEARPITWFVGFTPDARSVDGTTSRMAGLMLEQSDAPGTYQPGVATSGLEFGYARAPLWRAAAQGIGERPLLGWGPDAFAEAYQRTIPGIERQELVPAHPHNLVLWVLFEKGVIGLIGLGLLLVALFGLAVRYRDLGVLAIAAAVLVTNLFDATLLSGAVLYPLAALAGWRSAMGGARRTEGTEGVRQLVVRATLAASDLAVAFVALLTAQALAERTGAPFGLTPALLYALLAWPALSWREMLYPGYGLTAAQELKKQTTSWAYAALTVAVGSRLFPEALPITGPGLVTLLAGTLIGVPLARAGAKRLLHAMRVWGRPVVILGAGNTGQRVARALRRTPLDGLHPLAFFDDRADLRGQRVAGLRVRGSLDDARAFAARHDVQHAIVAIPHLDVNRLDRLTSGSSRAFRRVQFVPKLGGLPSDDVVATELDGMLALEVRNGLYAPANRLAKRAVDLIIVSAATVVASPLLLALWAWVRLDSPGGGFHHSARVGQDGRRFHCLKFRTMHEDAEERLHEILIHDPARREEYRRWHKLADDPRITRAGRFLRRTSLDELPQLWNVLKGEMSLVGPRPYLAREIPDMGHHAEIIFQAKPGITGFWQVSARSRVDFAERLEMEAHYVRNWSVWWDVILLVQTPVAVLRDEGGAK